MRRDDFLRPDKLKLIRHLGEEDVRRTKEIG